MKKILVSVLATSLALSIAPYTLAKSKKPHRIKKNVSATTSEVIPAAPISATTSSENSMTTPVWPVPGIYMPSPPKGIKTLADITGPASMPAVNSFLSAVHIRGWIDGNYVYNFNTPTSAVANANQALSIVKGNDITVEGRVFDAYHNLANLSLAEVELEKIPERNEFGFKLNIAGGQTPLLMSDTMLGVLIPGTAPWQWMQNTRYIPHASVSYIAPMGEGLRIDFGKFITHIGAETIESEKNWNYSRSIQYTYAIPYQDAGVHLSYPWTSTFYTDFYVLQGWNVIADNNTAKSFGPSVGWTITPWMSVIGNYLVGPEQNNNNSNLRHIVDAQLSLGPFFDRLNFMVGYDWATDKNAIAPGIDANWNGVAGYVRFAINDVLEPSVRIEYYNDPQGFTTGVPQRLNSYTFTLNTKIAAGPHKATLFLLRPEIRYDRSSNNFFSNDNSFRVKNNQFTMGFSAAWIF